MGRLIRWFIGLFLLAAFLGSLIGFLISIASGNLGVIIASAVSLLIFGAILYHVWEFINGRG